ncbi:MAG: response regulator [Spirochaetes bacterium]|nr:response regulator [Spirochaetota bacterium]
MSPKRTILAVDDNRTTLALLRKIFEKTGYRVLTGQNGDEALDILADQSVDLVTLDADMPVADGFSTCRKIRENPKTASLPVIMITAHDTAEEIMRGFEAGVSDYLVKPIKKDELLPLISAYFSQNSLSATEKIAVVCAEQATRAIIDYALLLNGFNGYFFGTLDELLERNEQVNKLIFDIPDGEKDIAGIIQKVRRKFRSLPLIVLSGDSSPQAAVNAYLHGASEYMIKPFNARVLAAKVLSIYRANRYKAVREENRVKTGRIDLLHQLYTTLAHHINNILCSLSLRIEFIDTKVSDSTIHSTLGDMKGDVKKIQDVLSMLEEIVDEEEIPLETYLDDIQMIDL